MAEDVGEKAGHSRGALRVALACAAALAGGVALLTMPHPVRLLRHLALVAVAEGGPFVALLAAGAILTRWPARPRLVPVAPGVWTSLDDRASWLLRGRLSAVIGVACLFMLAGWVPHYLTWPWWSDLDHFAVSAQSWDRGILPYRDLHDFNFPGPLYVFWVLGKVFGWGRTSTLYAVDAALVALLGVALAHWSRRRFASALPGLTAYLVFLAYYLSLDYSQVAQRDWQGPFLAVLGLFILEVRPGRAGRLLSAFAFAAALAFRPHAALFLPAAASAIDENARGPGEPPGPTIRALAEWGLYFSLGMLMAFTPLLLSGIADDLARSFRAAWYGGHYDRSDRTSVAAHLYHDLARWETSGVLAVLVLQAVHATSPLRRMARTWALALLFVLFYKPISPVVFPYHGHPLKLVSSVGIGLAMAWVLSARRLIPSVRVLALAAVVSASVSGLPANWSFERSARAVRLLWRGVEPARAPLGCKASLPDARRRPGGLSWQDYCAVLAYLRNATGPDARVANFLRQPPWPPVNGPVGRLTPFPCGEGIQWLYMVAPGLQQQFADALALRGDSVVVWCPDLTGTEPVVRLDRLERTVRRLYQPEARFGAFAVWRRKPDRPAGPVHSTGPTSNSSRPPCSD